MGKAPKSVVVSLTDDDLYFISSSIGLNIPREEEMTPTQLRTARKIWRAEGRLQDKINFHAAMARKQK